SAGTSGQDCGTSTPKLGWGTKSCCAGSPRTAAWTIARVYRKLIRLPVPSAPPVQPVFTSHTLTSGHSSSFCPRSSAYRVGCSGRNTFPKQAENVVCGSLIPTSVPATFAVYPDKKWYMACAVVSLAIGGSTPNASQVRKKMFLGVSPTDIFLAFLMCDIG